MPEVHYRVLRYRRGGALGDRLVLGLVHWDGSALRFAFEPGRVGGSGLSGDDSAVRGAVRAFHALARKSAAQVEKQGTFLSLEDLFRVPAGVGSSLEWSDSRFAQPSRPAEHFESLCKMHRLVKRDTAEQDRLTEHRLREGLRTLGERIRAEHGYGPDKLRVGEPTAGGVLSYTPPLSWKNGVWHHAVPVSFDVSSDDTMKRRAFLASGLLVGGIAADDYPVVIIAMPRSPDETRAAKQFQEALASIRDANFFEIEHTCCDEFVELEQMIIADVDSAP